MKFLKTLAVLTAASLLTVSSACVEINLSGDDNKNENASENPSESTFDLYTGENLDENRKTMYVTGTTETVAVHRSDSIDGEVVAELSCGDSVTLINSDSTSFYYVQTSNGETRGYVKKTFLTDEASAVCNGVQYFTVSDTPLYEKVGDNYSEIKTLKSGTELVVMAMRSGEYWFVNVKDTSEYGYVKCTSISSQKPETTSKDKTSSTAGKEKVTKAETAPSDSHYFGAGAAPNSYEYEVYTASVRSGYLAIRNARAYDSSNELGKIYSGQSVYIMDKSTGEYWYGYSPTLGIYGYVNSNYLVYGTSTGYNYSNGWGNASEWVVYVPTNYLALRSAPAYQSSNEIGKLYSGDVVYVDSSLSYNNFTDTYWYVYSPKHGKAGYVNSNYIYS